MTTTIFFYGEVKIITQLIRHVNIKNYLISGEFGPPTALSKLCVNKNKGEIKT